MAIHPELVIFFCADALGLALTVADFDGARGLKQVQRSNLNDCLEMLAEERRGGLRRTSDDLMDAVELM